MPGWVLALASCVHIALAVVRQHRSSPGVRRVVLVLAGYGFALAPWVWPTESALGIGIVAHVGWMLATDWIAHARPSRQTGADGNPSTAARHSDARPPGAASSTPVATRTAAKGIARGFVPLTVLGVVDETPDIRTFRLSRPEGFTFLAGQFLPVRLRVDGADHVRCYSISSAPHTPGFLEISVKRQGLVSGALHATLRPGSTLHARTPGGAFVYPAQDDRPIVLLAAGVGITPLLSMLRHGVHAEPQRPIVLVQSARTMDGLAFADELRVLARRHASFRWVPAVSRGDVPRECYPGRIDTALLEMAAPNLAQSIACVCGPLAMIDATRVLLASMGMAPAQVRFERFETAVAAAGTDAEPLEIQATGGTAPVVTFSRSNATAPAPASETLLDVAERSGVDIPSLCRAGVCGTCRTRVTDGDVHCHSTTLDADDAADGFVLACVAHARTDCTVDA